MTPMMTIRPRYNVQRGFSLVEIMVGIVIGMIAVLVIYQVFAAAEGIKRNTTSVGDAQQNGLLSSFMLHIELANASNGVADAMAQLGNCTASVSAATSLRPIPILISDSGADATPDTFVVNYSVAQHRVTPAPADKNGSDYIVQSPNGFVNSVAKRDLIIAIPGTPGDCAVSRVSAYDGTPIPCITDPTQSCVKITPVGATVQAAYVLDMGPTTGGVKQRVQYDVNGGVLRSIVLWNGDGQPVAQPPDPIASNVVNMKLLYGVDDGAGGITWTPATGPWNAATVLAANNSTLGKIRAVRIGIVVQGEQFDKEKYQHDLLFPPSWELFKNVLATPLTGLITPGFRVRVYETSIPLRNSLFNPVS
jgi:type IV pilus assembly protein PilW